MRIRRRILRPVKPLMRITIVRHVGKVHFRSGYDILGHDKASFFPKIGYIYGWGM